MDRQHLAKRLVDLLPEDGERSTALDGVTLFRASHPVDRLPGTYPAGICIPLQGTKRAHFDGRTHIYDSSQYLCCSVPLPVEGEVLEASPQRPLVGMMVSCETPTMAEASAAYEAAEGMSVRVESGTQSLVSVPWDSAFCTAVEQLLEALADPILLQLTGKGRLWELLVAVLRGPAGPMLLARSRHHRSLVGVITHIRENLDTPLRIEEMAKLAGMSKPVFHRQFKEVTSETPLQFIKALRLNEGARLLLHGTPVGRAATEVGYVSASQFSRDFQRQYSCSPRQWRSAAGVSGPRPAGQLGS